MGRAALVSTTAAALLGGGVLFASSASAAGPTIVSVTAAAGSASGTEVVTGVVKETSTAGYVRVDYGPTTSYGSASKFANVPAGTANFTYTPTLANLVPGATYHYHLVVGDLSTNETASADKTFVVPLLSPSAVGGGPLGTEVVSDQGNPNGVASYMRVDYGLTTSYGNAVVRSIGSGTALVNFAGRLTGLTPGATYHYEVVQGVVATASEVSTGDRTFVAGAAGTLPQVMTIAAGTGPTTGTEVVYGQVNAHGTRAGLRLDYGLTTAYGTQAFVSAGNSLLNSEYGFTLSNLTPGATYHYRVAAINLDTVDESDSADQTFTAATVPAVPAAKWIVKSVYLYPTDRPYSAAYSGAIEGAVQSLQPWYQGQVGTSSFHLGTAKPLACALPQNAAYYSSYTSSTNDTWTKLTAALRSCAGYTASEHTFWAVYADIPAVAAPQAAGQSIDDACNANRLGQTIVAGYQDTPSDAYTLLGDTDIQGLLGSVNIGCNSYVDAGGVNRFIGGLGHEMGHGFGLQHANWEPATPTAQDSCQYQGTTTESACTALGAAIMGWGYGSWPNTFVSPFDINILKASPFFF